MKHFLRQKLLGIPILVWLLQLLYVALILSLLVAIVLATELNDKSSRIKLFVVIPYIIIMITIDIAWRIALKRRLPDWYGKRF